MPRLIDADAAVELLRNLGSRDYRREKGTIADAMKMLSHDAYTPTIDPESLRPHGRWEYRCNDGVYEPGCTNCGYFPGIRFWRSQYCPHCGAKMDEEE